LVKILLPKQLVEQLKWLHFSVYKSQELILEKQVVVIRIASVGFLPIMQPYIYTHVLVVQVDMNTVDNHNSEEKKRIMNQIRTPLCDTKVPEPVLERGIHDPLYLHHLLQFKDSPSFLKKLISEVTEAPFTTFRDIKHPNLKEIANATQAILSATAIPSLRTSDTELKLRLNACYSCSNRVSAPNQGIYKLSKMAMGTDICRLCGCHIETKARLAREQCPAPDESNPGFNRWRQAIQ